MQPGFLTDQGEDKRSSLPRSSHLHSKERRTGDDKVSIGDETAMWKGLILRGEHRAWAVETEG